MILYTKNCKEPKTRTKFILWPRNLYDNHYRDKVCIVWLQRVRWKSDGYYRYASIPGLEMMNESKMSSKEWIDYHTNPPSWKWYNAYLWGFGPDCNW